MSANRGLSFHWVPLFLAAISIIPAWGSAAEPATWLQWRGPNRDGTVAASPVWPERLTKQSLQLAWKKPLEPSYSGPIVTADLVIVTETRGRKQEVVRALDRRTGEQRWETSWEGSLSVPFFAKSNGDWIRSTPACDGKSLFVCGIRDVLVSLDVATGKRNWQVDFVQELNTDLPAFGCVCSPLLDGEFLYVQAGAAFCKLRKTTGEIIWRTLADKGGMYGSAFSSPSMAEIAGRRQLLVQTREELAGVDPEDGKVQWKQKIEAFRGMNILTPTVVGENVFTSAYGGKSQAFSVSKQGADLVAQESWNNKARGYMSTPVVIDGNIYLHLQNQRFTCLDGKTGETRWTSTPYGKYWSLVAQGDKILALDERGELLLIRANPKEFELIDTLKISQDETWAHLAICDNELFIRELNAIACCRWTDDRTK